MEFKGVVNHQTGMVNFVISDSEVDRAKMGFEAKGNSELSDRLRVHMTSGVSGMDAARLVVAGNVALAESLSIFAPSDAVITTATEALATVNSGLEAVQQARQQLSKHSG